jgi:hypothetical protein
MLTFLLAHNASLMGRYFDAKRRNGRSQGAGGCVKTLGQFFTWEYFAIFDHIFDFEGIL